MKEEQVSISKFSIKILTLRTRINNDNTTFKAYCHAGREESSKTIFILLLLLSQTLCFNELIYTNNENAVKLGMTIQHIHNS